MPKVFNRGVEINVPASKAALVINGLNVFGINSALYAGNAAKTAQNQIRGRLKLDVRPTGGTTEDYALQIRANSAKTTGTFLGLDNESHLTANGAATLMSTRGVAVVDSGYTQTGGTLIGVYGQARADGTVAGAGFMAALYGLIEASAAIIASHVASLWLDSHQANAVTGEHELLYMTNNGAAVMDSAMFLYGPITNLFSLDTVTGMVADATGATLVPTRKIKIRYRPTPNDAWEDLVILAGTV